MRLAWIAGVLVVAAMVALAWSLAMGANDQAELKAVSRQNCQQIEALKSEFRKQALESYEQLEESLSLLGVAATPDIRNAAVLRRDKTLARFAAGEC